MKLLIGADIVPTKTNQNVFESGRIEDIVDANLLKVIADANYSIFNLECPLTDLGSPILKYGPNLIASTASIAGIKNLDIDFFTLANNHILDQGEQGLYSTINVLESAGIAYAGVGNNLSEAQKPYIATIGEKKVGIYCCAEHEFSIATKGKPGANPFDPLDSLDHIAELKDKCDYLICLYHGGKEHYRYPSPNLQKICRKIIEKGANLVVCQHSHCIGCKEDYLNGTIVYGQGNFLFDNSNSEFWQTSLLVSVNLDNRDINYIPLQKDGNGVKLAQDIEAKEILDAFNHRSTEILKDNFVEAEYSKFAKLMVASYMVTNSWLYNSIIFRAINKLSGNRLRTYIANKKIKKYGLQMLNRYECEAHRELIIKELIASTIKETHT